MKIVFNGVIERRRKGCSVCGKTVNSAGFTTTKTYILPSGITKTFRAGRVEEVQDMDAEFLLSYRYMDGKEEKSVFEVYDG